jgi:hypothetical protein
MASPAAAAAAASVSSSGGRQLGDMDGDALLKELKPETSNSGGVRNAIQTTRKVRMVFQKE